MAATPTLNPRTQRRNFLFMLGDFTLFGVGFVGILNPSVLPPAFVAALGGGPILIGLAGMLFGVVWHTPQLFFAWWVNRAPYKKRYVVAAGIPARAVFFPAALLMLVAGPEQPGLLIFLMLGAYAALAFGDSFCMLGWLDILGSSINDRMRSWLFGFGEAAVNVVGALLVARFVYVVLDTEQGMTFPENYALLLLVAGALLLFSLMMFTGIREGASPTPEESPSLRQYGRFLSRLVREDVMFRRFLAARFVYTLVEIAVPFYVAFAIQVLGQPDNIAVSDSVAVRTLTNIFAPLILGRLAERYGTRLVILIGAVAAVLHPLLALSASVLGPVGIHLAWVAYGIVTLAGLIGFLNWLVEYAPPAYRPIYGGMAYTVLAAALFSPLLGGVIVEASSYQVVFILASALGVVALFLLLRLPEPRHRQPDAVVLPPLPIGETGEAAAIGYGTDR